MPRPAPTSSLADLPELAEIIRSYAAPLAPVARSRFYEAVDRKLDGHELGPGIVVRVCAEVQKSFLTAPAITATEPRPPVLRSSCERRAR
jgi:hypothetical protein